MWDEGIAAVEGCVKKEKVTKHEEKKEENVMNLDLQNMIGEAQDLRPSFYKAICHIIRKS